MSSTAACESSIAHAHSVKRRKTHIPGAPAKIAPNRTKRSAMKADAPTHAPTPRTHQPNAPQHAPTSPPALPASDRAQPASNAAKPKCQVHQRKFAPKCSSHAERDADRKQPRPPRPETSNARNRPPNPPTRTARHAPSMPASGVGSNARGESVSLSGELEHLLLPSSSSDAACLCHCCCYHLRNKHDGRIRRTCRCARVSQQPRKAHVPKGKGGPRVPHPNPPPQHP